MMMIPKRRDFDLLDDMFGGVFFNEGESKLMKTDIKEKKDEYVIDIDLPGYEKEGIKLNIQDGYLTVHATVNKEEKDEEKGKFVRKERYSGECSRSFYVGENVTENEIKAKFKNGTLTIEIPKKEEKKEPLDLTGTWKSDENEGTWMEATISDNVISIDWVTDEGKTKATYWVGSYDAPTTATSEYSWVSNNDHEKTKNALLASNDDTKEFTYKNDILSFTASMQGVSKVVELKKQ